MSRKKQTPLHEANQLELFDELGKPTYPVEPEPELDPPVIDPLRPGVLPFSRHVHVIEDEIKDHGKHGERALEDFLVATGRAEEPEDEKTGEPLADHVEQLPPEPKRKRKSKKELAEEFYAKQGKGAGIVKGNEVPQPPKRKGGKR